MHGPGHEPDSSEPEDHERDAGRKQSCFRQPLGKRAIESAGDHQHQSDEGEDEEVVVVGHAEGRLGQPRQRGLEIGKREDREEIDEHQHPDVRHPQDGRRPRQARKLLGRSGTWPPRLFEHEEREHESEQREQRRQCPHAPRFLLEKR